MTDADRLAVFRLFLRETPPSLAGAAADSWPGLFEDRVAFEEWRARWLPYLAGISDGPSTRDRYESLRWRLRSGRMRDVDHFHTAPPRVGG